MSAKNKSKPAPFSPIGLKPIKNNAQKGTKVIFGPAPLVRDNDRAHKFLKPGETYTVERTEDDKWSPGVFLREVPNERFAAVMFWEAPIEANKASFLFLADMSYLAYK